MWAHKNTEGVVKDETLSSSKTNTTKDYKPKRVKNVYGGWKKPTELIKENEVIIIR